MALELTPAERLAEVRKSWPEAAKLAEPLALAARIEPELLREIRLAAFPRSHASLEADFYFSPLVAQRTPQWLVLDTLLAHELRNGLTSAMKRRPERRKLIQKAHQLVVRAHTSIPFEITREEEIIWLSVERPYGTSGARKAIDAILREFLPRMLAEEDQAGVVARWFASAAERLPSLARDTPAFALLGFAASSVLGGRQVGTGVNPSLQTLEELARYLPTSARKLPVWVGLTSRGLHFVPRETARYQQVEFPLTNPVLLEARVEGETPRLITMHPGLEHFVPASRTPVAIRTLGRDLLTFRARVQGARSEAAQGPQQQMHPGRRIHLVFRHSSDTEFARRLLSDLQSLGHTLLGPIPEQTDDDWADALRAELDSSDCTVVVLSQTAMDSPWVQQEIQAAQQKELPVFGALAERMPSGFPWRVFDLSSPSSYRGELSALHEAVLAVPVRTKDNLPEAPALSVDYVVSPELLSSLHAAIRDSNGAVIVGPGGVGKTWLAAAYARSREAQALFPGGIGWFRRGDYDRAGDFKPHDRLFVFDDVSSADDDIASMIRRANGARLITTRDAEVPGILEMREFLVVDDASTAVNVLPLDMSIVLSRRDVETHTLNVDCDLQNHGSRAQRLSLIRAQLTGTQSFGLKWNVFYESSGSQHTRTRDAGPVEVAPGTMRLGIQFVGSGAMPWTEGAYVLELQAWLGGGEDRPPAFSVKRDFSITEQEMAALNRWIRATDSQWAGLHDEAIGIPVPLRPHADDTPGAAGAHPWELRIVPEQFIEKYSRHRRVPDAAGLHDLIERINADPEVADVRLAAFLLAVVEAETGTFRPIEQKVVRPAGSPIVNQRLGNVESGDAEHYRGRGYILVEGRANYRRLSESLNMEKDLIRDPELLLDPNVAYEALRFVLIKGGLSGKPLAQFINAEKADYLQAARMVFGTSSPAVQRVPASADTIERVLRECLAPREPPPTFSA